MHFYESLLLSVFHEHEVDNLGLTSNQKIVVEMTMQNIVRDMDSYFTALFFSLANKNDDFEKKNVQEMVEKSLNELFSIENIEFNKDTKRAICLMASDLAREVRNLVLNRTLEAADLIKESQVSCVVLQEHTLVYNKT